jgi:hypothetical protein
VQLAAVGELQLAQDRGGEQLRAADSVWRAVSRSRDGRAPSVAS